MDDQVTTSSVMAGGSPYPAQIDSESVVVDVAVVVVAAALAAAVAVGC